MKYTVPRIFRFAAILCIGVLLASGSSLALAFADAEGHWAEEAIDRWSDEYRIIVGSEGLFRPNADITRAEMAVLLDRILGYQAYSDFTFDDVAEEEWYADAVSRLNAAGVMLGDGRNANPKRTVTREQAVTMLARAFAVDTTRGLAGVLRYEDTAEISEWAFASVGAMTSLEYIQGNRGCFYPQRNLTRAEAVTIIDNIVSCLYQDGGVYTEDVEGNALIASDDPVVLRNMTVTGNLYIAYNVTNPVTLVDVTVEGEIVNFSGIEPVEFRFVHDSEDEPVEVSTDYITYENYQIPILEDVPVNSYDAALFYRTEDGRISYDSERYDLRVGIDVSAWQNEIDWQQVAAQGIDYAMIRVGFRGYTSGGLNEDPYFRRNIEGALEAGLDVGVYFFSQAITAEEAIEEARFLLERIEGYPISYPVVFDWEPIANDEARSDGLSTDVLCSAANAFCMEVQAAGYRPMIYLNLYAGYLRYDLSRISGWDIWLAQYAEVPTFYYDFQMWQYTAKGTVAGIEGGTDMNISFVNYAAF